MSGQIRRGPKRRTDAAMARGHAEKAGLIS